MSIEAAAEQIMSAMEEDGEEEYEENENSDSDISDDDYAIYHPNRFSDFEGMIHSI